MDKRGDTVSERTVAAISTPIGEGGISLIRVSGRDAIEICDKIFVSVSGKKLESLSGYTALFGHIKGEDGPIDEAVVTVFREPKSYTGEDVCEISCHGGRFVTSAVLEAVLSAGAMAAGPGEFTKRAFLNGKLDLAEAESVMGLINAKSGQELKAQLAAKSGKTSEEISEIESVLLELSADFAAYSDYPDEELPDLSEDNFLRLINLALSKLERLLSTYHSGTVLREGVKTAIVGKPNVGKSTLMNLLSGEKRSIVTDIAGTTRDIIENTVRVGDITLILADTAGIRASDDPVEELGVGLAKERIASSQLVLAVFDISSELDSDDKDIISLLSAENTVIVLNKSDIGKSLDETAFEGFRTVLVSAKEGIGAEELERAVAHTVGQENLDPDAAILLSERQFDLTKKAAAAVNEAKNLLAAGFTIDAVGVCVDEALTLLYTLDGKRVTNEVADEVFRRFCVGK